MMDVCEIYRSGAMRSDGCRLVVVSLRISQMVYFYARRVRQVREIRSGGIDRTGIYL